MNEIARFRKVLSYINCIQGHR